MIIIILLIITNIIANILGGWVVLLGCSNPSLFTKSLSWVFILLLKLAIQVGLPLVEVLVCPVGPLIFPSLSSDHFLLSLINCAFVALLSFARGTQSIRLQKISLPIFAPYLMYIICHSCNCNRILLMSIFLGIWCGGKLVAWTTRVIYNIGI